jgi:DNA-nicking Smr family endonuclease
MPKEEDERIWREFIENGGNLKNQTERIKKDLAKRKSNLVEKKRRNLPKPANLTKRLIKKIATKKIQINSTLDLHGHNKTSAKLKFTNFIKDCQKNKQKYILIITGKGKGLIREALFEWIDEEKFLRRHSTQIEPL